VSAASGADRRHGSKNASATGQMTRSVSRPSSSRYTMRSLRSSRIACRITPVSTVSREVGARGTAKSPASSARSLWRSGEHCRDLRHHVLGRPCQRLVRLLRDPSRAEDERFDFLVLEHQGRKQESRAHHEPDSRSAGDGRPLADQRVDVPVDRPHGHRHLTRQFIFRCMDPSLPDMSCGDRKRVRRGPTRGAHTAHSRLCRHRQRSKMGYLTGMREVVPAEANGLRRRKGLH